MLPLRDDLPTRRTPFVTWAIIALCIVAYFVWQAEPFSDQVEDVRFNLRHAAIPCEVVEGRPLSVDEVVATYELGDDAACGTGADAPAFDADKNVLLSVVTSIFMHGSLLHIGGNMLFLWIFGNNVEDQLGKVGFVLFYLVGGVVAAATHILFSADSTVPVVGASGAIAAVMGAYMVWFPNARVRTAIFMFFITIIDVRAKWVLGFWFVLQFFTDPNQGVAWLAHVGGFVFGVLVALVLRDRGDPRRLAHRRPARPGAPGGPDVPPWNTGPPGRGGWG